MNVSSSPSLDKANQCCVRVLLVDDHEIWRKGLCSMLHDSEFVVVAEASTASEVLPAARKGNPHLVLLDIRLAEGDGFDALSALHREFPHMLLVMLTTYSNPTYMARALAGGAVGYLLKGVSQAELLETLRAVIRGDRPLDSQNFLRSLKNISETVAKSDDLSVSLSRREEEVLCLLATGLSNRDIGQILFIAEGTVKSHVEHILTKLGINDRVQAAVWAARNGFTADPKK